MQRAFIDQFFAADRFDPLPHLIALGFAYLLALPIGWNREREERSAGLRTFPLVAVAACGFVQAAETFAGEHPDAMAKVMEGLITGVGFIGGGAILRRGSAVKGTATAASLWITGAIGAAVGIGALDIALMLSLVTLVTLIVFSPGTAPADTRAAGEGELGDEEEEDERVGPGTGEPGHEGAPA